MNVEEIDVAATCSKNKSSSIFIIEDYMLLIDEITSLYGSKNYSGVVEKCYKFLHDYDPPKISKELISEYRFFSMLTFSMAKDKVILKKYIILLLFNHVLKELKIILIFVRKTNVSVSVK